MNPTTANSINLNILVGEDSQSLVLGHKMLTDAISIIDQMDADMDSGCRMGRRFVANPSLLQRCQVVSDRLLTAMHTQNAATMSLMGAYIVTRIPEIATIDLNTEGEMEETMFYDHNNALIR